MFLPEKQAYLILLGENRGKKSQPIEALGVYGIDETG